MTICGTNEYMAPELLFAEEYSKCIDIYAYGMVILEIITRKQVGITMGVLHARSPQSKFHIDFDLIESIMPEDAPKSLSLLATECLRYEGRDRPSANEMCDWLLDLHLDTDDDAIPLPPSTPIPTFSTTTAIPASATTVISSSKSANGVTSSDGVAIGTDINYFTSSNDSSNKVVKPLSMQRRISLMSRSKSILQESQLWKRFGLSSDSIYDNKDALMAGYLNKKTFNGFRKWKKIWFTLSDCKLWWKNSDRSVTKYIDLSDAFVDTCKHNVTRFKIHYKDDSVVVNGNKDSTTDDDYIEREFAVDDPSDKVKWLACIGDVIDERKMQMTAAFLSNAAAGTATGVRCIDADHYLAFGSIDAWLSSLGLRAYTDTFVELGYTIEILYSVGITDEELESYIGITNQVHRQAMIRSIGVGYTDNVRVVVKDYKDYGGVIVYSIASRYKFNRSLLCVRFNDFKTFDALVRKKVKEYIEVSGSSSGTGSLLMQLPCLPVQGKILSYNSNKDAPFQAGRMADLERYLIRIASLAEVYPILLRLLTAFLNLDSTGSGMLCDFD